ncbi:MAG: glycosyltransferase family 1 protein [Pseudomonadota bacterium]
MANLELNARFLSRPLAGVDRVAFELASALDRYGLPPQISSFTAVHPARPATTDGILPRTMSMRKTRWWPGGHLWEQGALTLNSGDSWLLSLCNTGPVLRRKQIVMIHDAQTFRHPESYTWPFRLWYRWMLPRLGRRAALVLTVSHHAKAELERFGIVPRGKARVVPNGADHILRHQADLDVLARHGLERQGYFLALGSMAPHKNIPRIIEAARARQDQTLPLILAGGGSNRVFSADQGSSQSGVQAIGRVTDPELRALYENAVALVFPSLTEGFGLPPLEAMLCGCPVIASSGGALPETCGDAALFVDPADRSGWTKALEHLASDMALRKDMSAKGRAHAAAYTWDNAAACLVRHLSSTIPARVPSAAKVPKAARP